MNVSIVGNGLFFFFPSRDNNDKSLPRQRRRPPPPVIVSISINHLNVAKVTLIVHDGCLFCSVFNKVNTPFVKFPSATVKHLSLYFFSYSKTVLFLWNTIQSLCSVCPINPFISQNFENRIRFVILLFRTKNKMKRLTSL